MFLEHTTKWLKEAFIKNYNLSPEEKHLVLSPTKKEFEGDFTLVVFPFVKDLKLSPEQIGNTIGGFMKDSCPEVTDFNVVKGFLNMSFSNEFWKNVITKIETGKYGKLPSNGKKVMVEFSSPNTNKPLHLGHIRNILLGWSTAKIFEENGYEVVRTQIINDRGIAICKSMVAWQKYGEGKTPEGEGIKGDHFVGDFYVLFENKLKEEYVAWQETEEAGKVFAQRADLGQDKPLFFKEYKNNYFNTYSKLGEEARKMLIDWEKGDEEVVNLWKKMNQWVYDGFDVTYRKLGVEFDKLYYESDTYLLGKSAVQYGLEKSVFFQKEDGSIWVDLTDVGMDHKIVQRRDGTSVYITQDIGTAMMRYKDFQVSNMIYTVADEQDYHFQVLFEILKRLGEPYADGLYHLSYGMVELPQGKMKSREGTVVDADDLIEEVVGEARANTVERGEVAEMSEEEQTETIRKIGMAALKYFMIKVQPKKRMIFDPKESVDLQGQTGPYIQNAYVRIKSILRKNTQSESQFLDYSEVQSQEKALLQLVMEYPHVVKQACKDYDPSAIANYAYSLAKEFHKFYHDIRILGAEDQHARSFRIQLCRVVADILERSMMLLGVEMPERM
jgi:arginyl-tRNA synthetase